jgi:biotin carboxyl carrier protein
MIRVNVNNSHSYCIEQQSDKYLVNGTLHSWHLHQRDEDNYQIIFNNRCFPATVTREDGLLKIQINQNTYLLAIQDEHELMLEKLGIETKSARHADEIKAPMPGLIVEVLVARGDPVEAGQPLLILKAMKMENIIKSPHDGVVNDIFVKKDQIIEKDAVMLQF